MIPMSLTKEGSSIQIERMLINDSLGKRLMEIPQTPDSYPLAYDWNYRDSPHNQDRKYPHLPKNLLFFQSPRSVSSPSK